MLLTAFHILSNTVPVGNISKNICLLSYSFWITTLGTMAFVSSLLFQLSIPLNMLGSVYRDTRSHLVDLEKVRITC
jgi:ABC-type transport system involved in Fe-S cluster assembly fused permease/ATPase subunit